MSKEREKNSVVFLDLGGVVFEDNPNPNKEYIDLIDLLNGENIENIAIRFNLMNYLEELKMSKNYKETSGKLANLFLGNALVDKLIKNGELNMEELINAKIEEVKLRDEKIISKIRESFPHINVGIATNDLNVFSEVMNHYFPEIPKKFVVSAGDKDIKAFKSVPDFYYNASNRLYIPVENTTLVDDSFKNVDTMREVGGTGKLYNYNNEPLSDAILNAVEENIKRR